MENTARSKVTIAAASARDREAIYKIRHDVYANELNQHACNSVNRLTDDLDLYNHYVVARLADTVIGFISITPPNSKGFSLDKYFHRSSIPYNFDDFLYEVRLLTVIKDNRNSSLALVLMYAAFRWVQSHGGKFIAAICRIDLIDMYRKAGLTPLGIQASSGRVSYELSVASIEDLQLMAQRKSELFLSLQKTVQWQLPYLYLAPGSCYHGGSFFKAIGEDLQTLHKAGTVINADVLDAWFPPSARVLKAIKSDLPWLLQTSPPTHACGLIEVIAEVRHVKRHSILPGAGSSDLIFLGLQTLLTAQSRVLIIDPCYGEYFHVLEQVVKCRITKFTLSRENGFKVNTRSLLEEIKTGYDMVVMVNPNSPTGVYILKNEMVETLSQVAMSTIVWVDETYIEYAGRGESLEQFASKTENVIVCKSMSKVYALSGIRVAYLCCSPHFLETLKTVTPPWAISLPAQAAAIAALKDDEYYNEKYKETHVLREKLKRGLMELGVVEVVQGIANFLLFYLPPSFPSTEAFIEKCRAQNLFLRDVSNMGKSIGKNAVRIAVKDEATNNKMIEIMRKVADD